jgi:hypothetical protein
VKGEKLNKVRILRLGVEREARGSDGQRSSSSRIGVSLGRGHWEG